MMKPVHGLSRRSALGLIGAALTVPSASFANSVATAEGAAFGTRWRITGPAGQDVSSLVPVMDSLFARIDQQFSPWRPDSVLSGFNTGRAGAFAVAHDFIKVTTAALEISRRSEGAFDPTVGPLVARWGFGPIMRGGAPDWRALSVRSDSVAKERDDLTMDLCGIAKGWALDQAAEMVRAAGFNHLLLELGGEFVTIGHHPDGRDWQIAVEAPMPRQTMPAVLRLPAGAAVATSGVRAQSYIRDGRIFSHIIDPETQSPVMSGLRSVTVVAPDAKTADGWATALFAAGDIAGADLAVTHQIAALFVTEENGTMRQMRTGQISDMIL